jgi:hypothetical protein
MQRARAGQHALRHRMRRRQHQVVARQVELLHRQRHQAEIVAEPGPRPRQALDERRARHLAAQEAALGWREEVADREQVGIREQLQQLLHDAFRSGMTLEPFVDDGDLHRGPTISSRRRAAASQE